MSERCALSSLWNSIQTWLFLVLEDEIGELNEKRRQFVAICELCAPQDHLSAYRWIGNSYRPPPNKYLSKSGRQRAVVATALHPIGGERQSRPRQGDPEGRASARPRGLDSASGHAEAWPSVKNRPAH